MITSGSNSRIKQLVLWNSKAKERKKDDIFLVEGIKMFLEAPKEIVKEVYVSEGFLKKADVKVMEKLKELPFEEVKEELFGKISDTKTPQGILCVLKRPDYTMADILGQKTPFIVILEDLQDPGNLGTILRTGEGAGISGVLMSKDTVDIYNPKTIRATMGSIYRVPFLYVDSLDEAVGELQKKQIKVYAAHLKGKKTYEEHKFTTGTAFLIGNEGNGLKDKTASLADEYLRIPMEGQVESLNAAIATSILMYETLRQRRVSDKKEE